MRLKSTLFLAILPFLLSACGGNVAKVDFNPARALPENASPAPLLFRGLDFLIPPGKNIGFTGNSSRGCNWPRQPVSRTTLRRAIDAKFLKESFSDALESTGYDVVGSNDILPEEQEDEQLRTEYTIRGKVKSVEVDLCEHSANNLLILFAAQSGTNGEAHLSIEWSVYDPLKRTVVYKTTTEGYTKRRTPNQEGLTLMLHEAFEMAAHNLGADKEFYDLIVDGKNPDSWRDKHAARTERNFDARRIFDPLEPVTIAQTRLSREAFTKNIDHKRKNTVVIQKLGHGSGFFISGQGHILTNSHVVGDAIRMRIITANKEEKLTAEVLRSDKARDVALLKLETIPEGLEIVMAPIRAAIPNVGEDVYVLGAPRHASRLQDTLTKGIVSAYRKELKFVGDRQSYIQSDVEIHGGNSGGPLFDANGNIIGLSVASLYAPEGDSNGLNLFVPIGEALDALGIPLHTKTP